MSNAFDLDVWVKEARKEPFRFTLAGQTFAMPAAGELDKAILKAVNVDNPSATDIETLLRHGLDDQWEQFDSVPAPLAALGELFRQWQKHEGTPLGESSASADS
ncbi:MULTISPECIES: hypothetical protein [Streptomyces]|uniref:hypothetical protein n=1 Tax=Streptomyces TaxID=1883 RepID=UPI001E2FC5BE|nr:MULTISPECIES: hypothetical protein [Streptomyces]UFQ15507.1 hypothetical protein J2N69_11170 [Streptomyces huasconensis]WCL85110.1 hypothetical protein PPN52_11180 [Streptomyces sp. JCM 35825]